MPWPLPWLADAEEICPGHCPGQQRHDLSMMLYERGEGRRLELC